jgi:hypothetical protein
MKNDTLALKDAVLDSYKELEDLDKEMHQFLGDEAYIPKYNFGEFYQTFRDRTDEKVYVDLIRKLDIDYIDETWQKADWIVVFIAGSIGVVLDVLITQTKILKPVDKIISTFMKSGKVQNFKRALDKFSNSFRDGKSAPIDFQEFDMYGLKSIHEQYSFGHDPMRFIEGICQMITGDYRGIDKFGTIITAKSGEGISEEGILKIIQGVISYIAHMVSDLCNANSLPYPGSTFLMQFGNEKTRYSLAAAYRSQLYNSRMFIYQNLPSFIMSMIIHGWAVYDNYTQTKKIDLLIGNNLKYQPMLLVSNATAMTLNLTITDVREAIKHDHRALFRVNWPVIANTVKHSIKYLINEDKRINENGKKIKMLLEDTTNNRLPNKSEEEYLQEIEKEYNAFIGNNLLEGY